VIDRSPAWCVRPLPEDDELLSSWLHRLAIGNALCDHTLCRYMFGNLAVWNRDLDRSFPDSSLESLAQWTSLPVERLRKMRLTNLAGRLSERINAAGASPWILPAGIYHRMRRRAGLQYCPKCLREREANAFWMWRMAWSTCCSRHHCQLLDRCPRCRSPYMAHRTAPSLFGRACCDGCGCDLSRTDSAPAEPIEGRWQLRLEEAVRSGWLLVGSQEVLALSFFEGLRTLVRVLLSRRSVSLRNYLMDKVQTQTIEVSATQSFEFESIEVRRSILAMAFVLLSHWPTRFLAATRRCGTGRWAFARRDGGVEVYWLQQALDRIPLLQKRHFNVDELRAACTLITRQGGRITVQNIKRVLGLRPRANVPTDLKTVIADYKKTRAHRQSVPRPC